jgi:transcriptional regulator with XRE-family HTH domain
MRNDGSRRGGLNHGWLLLVLKFELRVALDDEIRRGPRGRRIAALPTVLFDEVDDVRVCDANFRGCFFVLLCHLYSNSLPNVLHESSKSNTKIQNNSKKALNMIAASTYGCSILVMPTLGEVIKKLRKERHWSQDKLGALAGVNGQTISNIETGTVSEPQGEKLEGIAKALGTTVQAIDAMRIGAAKPQAPDSGHSGSSRPNGGQAETVMPSRMNAAELARQINDRLNKGGDVLTVDELSKMAKRAAWDDPAKDYKKGKDKK